MDEEIKIKVSSITDMVNSITDLEVLNYLYIIISDIVLELGGGLHE